MMSVSQVLVPDVTGGLTLLNTATDDTMLYKVVGANHKTQELSFKCKQSLRFMVDYLRIAYEMRYNS